MNKSCPNYILIIALIVFTAPKGIAATRYFKERTFSPVTIAVADNVRAIVAKGASKGRHVGRFMKVGDSITASDRSDSKSTPNSQYLCQFVCPDWTASSQPWDYTRRLDVFQPALGPVLSYFLADTLADGTSSFNRASVAAGVGWASDQAVSGNPCPLRAEIETVSPGFAIVMYGANDAGGSGSVYSVLSQYMGHMHRIVDTCLAEGIVPILMSTCPRLDAMEISLGMSHLVRCLAQQHQIPFVDYHRAMMPLANHGMGSDGLHPTGMGYNQYCWFTPEGLKYGYNLRNLFTLQALDRMTKITADGGASLDPNPPALMGTGTITDPFIVDSIPFVDINWTSVDKSALYYKLTVNRPMKVRTFVTYQNGSFLSIALLNASFGEIVPVTGAEFVDKDLEAGTYYVLVLTSGTMYGEFQFILYDRENDGSPAPVTKAMPKPAGLKQQPRRGIFFTKSGIELAAAEPGVMTVISPRGKRVFQTGITRRSACMRRWNVPSTGSYIVEFTGKEFRERRKGFFRRGSCGIEVGDSMKDGCGSFMQ